MAWQRVSELEETRDWYYGQWMPVVMIAVVLYLIKVTVMMFWDTLVKFIIVIALFMVLSFIGFGYWLGHS